MHNGKLMLLITGSREVQAPGSLLTAARAMIRQFKEGGFEEIRVIHGGAKGVDSIWNSAATLEGVTVNSLVAEAFPTPLVRNTALVQMARRHQDAGWQVMCLAYAREWASGTGNCARTARKYGILTLDQGVSTRKEDRPS